MKFYVGVEFGVKQIVAGVTDKNGKLLRKASCPTNLDRPYEEQFNEIAELIRSMLDEEAIDIRSVKYIGVGFPGIPNKDKGTIVRNYTMNLINLPVREELQKHFKIPVYVDNDANCAALAESVVGAAEDIDFSVLVRIGNGIGGGIIINNEIYSGFNFAGAELGHMCIAMGGKECSCGRKGCWEAYASGTAFLQQIAEAAQQHPESLINTLAPKEGACGPVFNVFEAAKQGDAVAIEVIDRYLHYLAEGLINIINMLMPNAIIIAGEISKLGEAFLKPLRNIVWKGMYTQDVEKPEFKIAQLGSAGIVVGAAMLGLFINNMEE
jgi:glucokinase